MLSLSPKKLDSLYKTLEPPTTPSMKDCFIYLSISAVVVYFIFGKMPSFLPAINFTYVKFFIALFGATYAYKNLAPYIKNVDGGFKSTLSIAAKLFFVTSLITWITMFISGKDPQNLQSYRLTNLQYYNILLDLPFTAIGEDVLKALMLLAFLRIFKPLKNKKFIISILLTSFIFGLFHINYNYDSALNIIFALGFSSIPSLLFFLYYKSLYPGMIIHFLLDFMTFTNLSANYSFLVLFFQLLLYGLILFFVFKQSFSSLLKS